VNGRSSKKIATMNGDISPPVSSFEEPSSTNLKKMDAEDDQRIQGLLSGFGDGSSLPFNFDDETPFDQTDKADDAEDYEDISDTDLPDEEEPAVGNSLEVPGLTDDGGTSNDTDDLFGDGRESSPMEVMLDLPSPAPQIRNSDAAEDSQHPNDPYTSFRDLNFDAEPIFNHSANQDPDIPAAAESKEDFLKQAWPMWKWGKILNWTELFPSKKGEIVDKKPVKKPKGLIISKLSIEIAPDQEKLFRIPDSSANPRKQKANDSEAREIIHIDQMDYAIGHGSQFDLDHQSETEEVGGFTLQDIAMTCDDWSFDIEQVGKEEKGSKAAGGAEAGAVSASKSSKRSVDDTEDTEDAEWDAMFMHLVDEAGAAPPRKKQRITQVGLPDIPKFTAPSFDDFEDTTMKNGKRVRLDVDDPYLLFEEQDALHLAKRPRLEQKLKRMANGSLRLDISQRFNVSNDDAYDAMKENYQSKVRALLGNLAVEHSLPALKLAWPYYKVKLAGKSDQFHRPEFRVRKFVGHSIDFSPLATYKRKEKKGKASEVFLSTKDLGMNDNATAVLFEYCERIPPVLSNFGMGSRVVNYHRKTGDSDEAPPKLEIGESQILLPEDKSPFSIFGEVDLSETMSTLHNQMYRAPIFKHTPKATDFICSRSTTGLGGSKWHLRKANHMYVVGQTFPSVEVPGPHSRKVTNASKNRTKMIAYRLMHRDPQQLISLSDIHAHLPDSNETQTRQKLKEFLAFAKGEKGRYGLKSGEVLMDKDAIRGMVKPEDVCLIDGMQLGVKQLEDAGFDPRNAVIDEEREEDDNEGNDDRQGKQGKKGADKGEETLADKMAPWKTSKAFIDACAGKAMLQLHGEGDPTGHGLGFSFIRTSMKGGYIEAVQGPLATSADAMERERRANGGHAYNVKKQEAMYKEGIREIWEKQKSTLSDPTEHDDDDILPTADEDDRFNVQTSQTPAAMDDGTSQISGFTSSSRQQRRKLKIIRTYRDAKGNEETREEIVEDPIVIANYLKRRAESDVETRKYAETHSFPTPDPISGLVFNFLKLPAYVSNSLVSTTIGRQAIPISTAVKWLGQQFPSLDIDLLTNSHKEFNRNLNDLRRIKHVDTPESSKRNSRKEALQTPARLKQTPQMLQLAEPRRMPTQLKRSLQALPGNAPTVEWSATSKPIKSNQPFFPPRPSLDLRKLFRSKTCFKLKSRMMLRRGVPTPKPRRPVKKAMPDWQGPPTNGRKCMAEAMRQYLY
jgi:transcription initiation factor TFIID subunit 1, fungi type